MTNLMIMMLAAVSIAAIGTLAGVVYVSVNAALNRWGRYELGWKFDDPFPDPKRFWTRSGALRYLAQMSNDTENEMFIKDRKTGKNLENV